MTAKEQDPTSADPSVQPDAERIREASGENVKGESGNQEDWRERHQEGDN